MPSSSQVCDRPSHRDTEANPMRKDSFPRTKSPITASANRVTIEDLRRVSERAAERWGAQRQSTNNLVPNVTAAEPSRPRCHGYGGNPSFPLPRAASRLCCRTGYLQSSQRSPFRNRNPRSPRAILGFLFSLSFSKEKRPVGYLHLPSTLVPVYGKVCCPSQLLLFISLYMITR